MVQKKDPQSIQIACDREENKQQLLSYSLGDPALALFIISELRLP